MEIWAWTGWEILLGAPPSPPPLSPSPSAWGRMPGLKACFYSKDTFMIFMKGDVLVFIQTCWWRTRSLIISQISSKHGKDFFHLSVGATHFLVRNISRVSLGNLYKNRPPLGTMERSKGRPGVASPAQAQAKRRSLDTRKARPPPLPSATILKSISTMLNNVHCTTN